MISPTLSVCIPVYNGAKTIERCIESVMAQPDWSSERIEVVVVDDCSRDETPAILDRLRGRTGLRVESNARNLGLTGNWQRALSLGRGELVTLLHMDDWHAPGCAAAAIEIFERDPQLVLAAFGQIHVLPDGTLENRNQDREVGVFTAADYVGRLLQLRDCPAPSMAFFRRSKLAALSTYYDAAYRWCPELDLYLRLAIAHPEGRFAHDPRVLIRRGASREQFSNRYPGYNVIDTCMVLERHLHRLSDSAARARSEAAARRIIAADIASVLRLRDQRQLREVFAAPSFQRWAVGSGWNVPAVAAFIAGRGLRKMGRGLVRVGRSV